MAFDSARGYLYASNEATVYVISTKTNKVLAQVPMCGTCALMELAYDPINGKVYLADWGGTVDVISDVSNKIVRMIPFEPNPFGVFFNTLNHALYVTSYDSGDLQRIDPSTHSGVVATTHFATSTCGLDVATASKAIYVTTLSTRVVAVSGF
jgi:DNA-binding beta-propeller fold protein YncE